MRDRSKRQNPSTTTKHRALLYSKQHTRASPPVLLCRCVRWRSSWRPPFDGPSPLALPVTAAASTGVRMTGSQAEPEARRAGGDGEPVVSLLAEERYTLRRPSGLSRGGYWPCLELFRVLAAFFFFKKSSGRGGPEHERNKKTTHSCRIRMKTPGGGRNCRDYKMVAVAWAAFTLCSL